MNIARATARSRLRLLIVDTDQLKKVVEVFVTVEISQFVGVEIDIDDAEHPPLRVDDREGEQPMEEEKLAGIQHGCRTGDRHHPLHHDVSDQSLLIREQQLPGGDHAYQLVVLIEHVEIDDPPLGRLLTGSTDRLADRLIGSQAGEIGPHVMGHRIVQVGAGAGGRHGVGGA
jgi:hypothetical protein